MKANVACVQFCPELTNKAANIAAMKSWVEKVMSNHPQTDLIVFPELALTGYECGEGYIKVAEHFPDGQSIKEMGRIAKEFNVHLVFGFVEQGEDANSLYNSAALVDNKGGAAGVFRKVHLVEGAETDWFLSGREYPVFDTPFGKIGIMICWDTAFPEVARILAINGAELIAVPAAWEEPNDGDWDLVQSARSFDNVIYIAACNRVGTDQTLTFFGKSKIVGPLGRVIKECDKEAGFIAAEIDLEKLAPLRQGYYSLLRDRRVSTYGDILKEYIERK